MDNEAHFQHTIFVLVLFPFSLFNSLCEILLSFVISCSLFSRLLFFCLVFFSSLASSSVVVHLFLFAYTNFRALCSTLNPQPLQVRSGQGGAISVQYSSRTTFEDSLFRTNTANQGPFPLLCPLTLTRNRTLSLTLTSTSSLPQALLSTSHPSSVMTRIVSLST